MSTLLSRSPRFSRRQVVGSGLAGAALLPLSSPGRVAAGAVPARSAPIVRRHGSASSPVHWRTWHLASPDEQRPAKPGAPTTGEIEEIVAVQAAPTEEQTTAIAQWGSGSAVLAWSALLPDLNAEFKANGVRLSRAMPLLHTAMADAVLAAWDAQAAYNRPSPAAADSRITPPPGVDPAQSSFPSAEAAVAGAAATVFAALYPDAAPGRFADLAQTAAMARLWAGAAFRSDIEAGMALGQAVGEKAVARAAADGADAVFDPATIPTGPGFWQPTPPAFAKVPVEPLAGTWKPWVLEKNDQCRPAPPPDYRSPRWLAEFAMVQETVSRRSLQEMSEALWWQTTTPPPFLGWAHELIRRDGLDLPHAARALAYLSVAWADAIIAVWDAKYTWWTVRPITEDSTLVTAFPTPNYPAYPSGYSALSGAASIVLGHFFPESAEDLADRGWEASKSRAWAGIHYMIDNETGLSMGRQIGRLVIALTRADESEESA